MSEAFVAQNVLGFRTFIVAIAGRGARSMKVAMKTANPLYTSRLKITFLLRIALNQRIKVLNYYCFCSFF
jgi:hypothetical protein